MINSKFVLGSKALQKKGGKAKEKQRACRACWVQGVTPDTIAAYCLY